MYKESDLWLTVRFLVWQRPNLYKHCIRAYLVVKIVPAHAVITETNNKILMVIAIC